MNWLVPMIIERLQIDGFGHFAGTQFDSLDDRIVVFLGENEAGKSTLLAFVQAVLFGFGRRPGKSPVPALNGGRHGGRIIVADSEGGRYVVERHAGPNGGPLTVSMPDGSTAGHNALARLLGVSDQVYCNVFSFDLQQLFDAGWVGDDSIKIQLYGAGLGTDRLHAALQDLEKREREIFFPGGRVQPVPEIVRQIQGIDGNLRRVASEAQSYHDLRKRLDSAHFDANQKRAELVDAHARRNHLNNLASAMDDWHALHDVERRLADLPEILSFPENGPARLEAFEDAANRAEIEEGRARQHAAGLRERLARPIPDAVLADFRDDLEVLKAQQESFHGWIADLPGVEREIETLRGRVDDGIKLLGPEWTLDQLLGLDTSIPVRNALNEHELLTNEARQDVDRASLQVVNARSEHQSAVARLQQASDRLALPGTVATSRPAVDEVEAKVRSARGALATYEKAVQYRNDQRRAIAASIPVQVSSAGSSTGMKIVGVGLMFFGAAAILAGLYRGGYELIAGLIVGLTALAVGLALYLRAASKPAPITQSEASGSMLQQAEREADAAQQQVTRAFAALGAGDASQGNALLDDMQHRIGRTREHLRDEELAATDVQTRQRKLASEMERLTAAQETLDQCQHAWRTWLDQRGLNTDLSPDSVKTMFSEAMRLRREYESIESHERQRADLTVRIERFTTSYATVTAALDQPKAMNPLEIAAATSLLIGRDEAFRLALEERKHLGEQLEEAEGAHLIREQELEAAILRLNEFIAQGGAEDGETFRVRARLNDERQNAERERNELHSHLRRRVTSGMDWQAFTTELDGLTTEELDVQLRDLDEQIKNLDEQIGILHREQGEIETKLARLASDETAVELRAEKAVAIEGLRDLAGEWSTYALAREILNRAQRRYEEERQPAVLQTAERYFRSITGGRYTRLIIPIGSDRIEVVRADEQRLTADKLSRGTQDQLYLSLRFGLIADFRVSRPPIIVDDVLVNFDPARARATAEAFVEMSATNQVLIFTCHPSTVDHFRAASDNVQVIELDGLSRNE